MTDNEIIKALEICADYENCVSIDKVLTYRGIPLRYLFENALDLINRQRAEIDRYKGVIKILEKDVDAAKSEAYKEFANKLENECILISDSIDRATMLIVIDAIRKELTEHKETVSMIDGHIEE